VVRVKNPDDEQGETLLKIKRSANRLNDLADLEALEKIVPYKK
jgi:hypothetical protein